MIRSRNRQRSGTFRLGVALLAITVVGIGCNCEKEGVETSSLDEEGFDLSKTGRTEEPFLSMMRSAQLLDALEIRGWSLAHIQSGDYMVYLRYEGKSEYLHGGKLDPSKAEYLFLRYARSGKPLTLFSLDNGTSASVNTPSPFRSSGRFRNGPIPAQDGSYTLVETYDEKGKVILKLDGIE